VGQNAISKDQAYPWRGTTDGFYHSDSQKHLGLHGCGKLTAAEDNKGPLPASL
jgi:hypothetical protein